MATSLFLHERIQTTTARAKALRPFAEKLITLARRGDLHARRQAARDVQDREVLQKLFGDIAARVGDRAGGYTRILKLGNRHGDNGEMSLIELVDREVGVASEGDEESGTESASEPKA
jgi:large subunit ribosomal protein L17